MSEKKTIVVVEKSFVIRKGLLVVLNQMTQIGKIIELDEEAIIHNRLSMYNPDIVIINPQLIGSIQKKNLRDVLSISKKTQVVALVYSFIDEQMLNQYDMVIRIDDTKDKIEGSFNKLRKLESEVIDDENRELSDREKEILVGVVKGLINKEIAEVNNISINTVITHRRNIARKLDIHSPAGLTVYAILNKLINIDDLKL
jgi:DNA-binding NarL/FixJ family response regulator